ncbi:MAG: hypothetical protein ACTS6G_00065 [Candidatus Hodgkinia cicadicola]
MFVTNTITSKDLNFEVKADGSAKSNKQLSAEASSELLINFISILNHSTGYSIFV